jgi:HSP20 family protein
MSLNRYRYGPSSPFINPFEMPSVFDNDQFFDGNPQSLLSTMTDGRGFPSTLTTFPTASDLMTKPGKSMSMKWDIIETPTEYKIHADLPGMTKENVNLEVDEGILTITAEKKESNEEEGTKGGGTYVVQERSWNTARRQLRLPKNVDENAITASMESGVLNVHLQKHEATETSKKRIEIQEN